MANLIHSSLLDKRKSESLSYLTPLRDRKCFNRSSHTFNHVSDICQVLCQPYIYSFCASKFMNMVLNSYEKFGYGTSLLGVNAIMLLRSSSHGLNSLFGHQSNSLFSVQLSQLHVTGNGDAQLFHHEVHPRFERTLSEAHLHNPLSNGSLRKMGLRSGSGTLELCRKLSTQKFVSNVVLDEAPEEEFDDSDAQISIGFQSAGDPQEEYCRGKNIAAIGVHAGEGSFVSGKRNDDLMSGAIFEGTGVALVCDRVVVGSKTSTASGNGGFGGEDGSGGGHGGRGDGSGSDSNDIDAYYKKMLWADPGNPLLLTNYARFLQEVQHDMDRADEYYRRAILASPGDGDALCSYANLIWDVHKDAPRAQSYFDQAVEAAPDDCNVLGSYAHFLWDAEVDEEDPASCIH